MNTLNQTAIATTESEYSRWSRRLEESLEGLKENLLRLTSMLEPVRVNDPRLEKPEQPVPEAPLSPLNDFIRNQTKKVQLANQAVQLLLREIQL